MSGVAEDGIRDLYVTGVQTCALPISGSETPRRAGSVVQGSADHAWCSRLAAPARMTSQPVAAAASAVIVSSVAATCRPRSASVVDSGGAGTPGGGRIVR